MKPFGEVEGRTAFLYELESELLRATVMDYAGALVSLETRETRGDGRGRGVVLGFDSVERYVCAGGSFGAVLGRNANRISGAPVEIGGRTWKLSENDDGVTLHGGKRGFGRRFWDVVSHRGSELELRLRSCDGDQGFPGTVEVRAIYSIQGSSLSLTFEARTDAPTFLSLSSHPYFNLDGVLSAEGCLGHEARIAARTFLPTDARQLPTGEVRNVEGTPFDFQDFHRIGDRIAGPDEQLRYGKGYDHYFVLGDTVSGSELRPAAIVRSPRSGLALELSTTQRGLQLYTGNNLNGSVEGRQGLYRQSAGFALEPQGFPDAPHHWNFPSTVLTPDQTYRELSVYHLFLM
jgi:aldose 1-epimerase